jgi:hypothetical protein
MEKTQWQGCEPLIVTQGDTRSSRLVVRTSPTQPRGHMAHIYPMLYSSAEMCCILLCIPVVEFLCHSSGNASRHRVRLHSIRPIGRTPRAPCATQLEVE